MCIFSSICICSHRSLILSRIDSFPVLVVLSIFSISNGVFGCELEVLYLTRWFRTCSSEIGFFWIQRFSIISMKIVNTFFAEKSMNIFAKCCECIFNSNNQEEESKIRWGFRTLTLTFALNQKVVGKIKIYICNCVQQGDCWEKSKNYFRVIFFSILR